MLRMAIRQDGISFNTYSYSHARPTYHIALIAHPPSVNLRIRMRATSDDRAFLKELFNEFLVDSKLATERAVTESKLATERAVTESKLATERAVTESKLDTQKIVSEFDKKIYKSQLLFIALVVIVLASAAPDSLVGKGASSVLSLIIMGV